MRHTFRKHRLSHFREQRLIYGLKLNASPEQQPQQPNEGPRNTPKNENEMREAIDTYIQKHVDSVRAEPVRKKLTDIASRIQTPEKQQMFLNILRNPSMAKEYAEALQEHGHVTPGARQYAEASATVRTENPASPRYVPAAQQSLSVPLTHFAQERWHLPDVISVLSQPQYAQMPLSQFLQQARSGTPQEQAVAQSVRTMQSDLSRGLQKMATQKNLTPQLTQAISALQQHMNLQTCADVVRLAQTLSNAISSGARPGRPRPNPGEPNTASVETSNPQQRPQRRRQEVARGPHPRQVMSELRQLYAARAKLEGQLHEVHRLVEPMPYLPPIGAGGPGNSWMSPMNNYARHATLGMPGGGMPLRGGAVLGRGIPAIEGGAGGVYGVDGRVMQFRAIRQRAHSLATTQIARIDKAIAEREQYLRKNGYDIEKTVEPSRVQQISSNLSKAARFHRNRDLYHPVPQEARFAVELPPRVVEERLAVPTAPNSPRTYSEYHGLVPAKPGQPLTRANIQNGKVFLGKNGRGDTMRQVSSEDVGDALGVVTNHSTKSTLLETKGSRVPTKGSLVFICPHDNPNIVFSATVVESHPDGRSVIQPDSNIHLNANAGYQIHAPKGAPSYIAARNVAPATHRLEPESSTPTESRLYRGSNDNEIGRWRKRT